MFFGYEDSNVIAQFRSVFLSQLNSYLLLVKLSVISHFCRCQFCSSPSISCLQVTRSCWSVAVIVMVMLINTHLNVVFLNYMLLMVL